MSLLNLQKVAYQRELTTVPDQISQLTDMLQLLCLFNLTVNASHACNQEIKQADVDEN